MLPRWRTVGLLWCVILAAVLADEAPPGLVSKDSEQDLVAEASHTGGQTQKREAGLSNSYGEPLPPDAYGPPRDISNIVPDFPPPTPVYGVPLQQPPPGAYGPPAPVFPPQNYEGPPPPISKPVYGPPKIYGPPKPIYGPPRSNKYHGPSKKTYGPPKQSLPKQNYGAPFKPPKIFSKPFGPKPIYGPPKPLRVSYGTPSANVQSIPLDLPPVSISPATTIETSIGGHHGGRFGASLGGGFNGGHFGNFGGNLGSNIDLGLNLPAPIYGTPLVSLPVDLKPNFPLPADTYGPPGHPLGPTGSSEQVLFQDIGSIGHYGPPQPDPNPHPPHPGIPAPPTPPHVLYDGWKPIPGQSNPIGHVEETIFHNIGPIEDQYGPPPPPPAQEIQVNFGQTLPTAHQHQLFSDAQITTGYSSVHQDAFSNIDLNALVGGDSNHIDQSKTVFEAHYTENHNPQPNLGFIHSSIPNDKPLDTYIAPPLESIPSGPYSSSLRQQGAKGLVPPSGVYGVPPGSQYGAPPRPPPSHLPIPYGSFSGGGHSIHTGGHTPRQPIKFRESVPEGLLENVGQTTREKDTHGLDHLTQGPAYLPPPIRDVKETNLHSSVGINLSIEPSNLYSLPHAGHPLNFQAPQPSNLYGSPIDSYSVPLLTVGDHTASGSNTNSITTTFDGMVLANLSNLDAAAILKHCPYHEAILKAAQHGDKIPADLASKYVASLNSLGSALSKNQQSISQNSFHIPAQGTQAGSYNPRDLATASHTLVQSVLSNNMKNENSEKAISQKGKALRDANKQHFKEDGLQFVSDQILQTSEKIKNLSEETRQLQQKLESTSQDFNHFDGQSNQVTAQHHGSYNEQNNRGHLNSFNEQTDQNTNHNYNQLNGHSVQTSSHQSNHFNEHSDQLANEIPVKGNLATYSLQIQSSNGDKDKGSNPTIPHDQLLSEGLLQSILQAIEQPNQTNHVQIDHNVQQFANEQISSLNAGNFDGGLVLPAGYEPFDRTQQRDQEIQGTHKDIKHMLNSEITHKYRGDIPDCDLKGEGSVNHEVMVPAPIEMVKPVEDIGDNDVAIFFNEKSAQEPVTEISVSSSISENVRKHSTNQFHFGSNIRKM